MKRPLIVGLGNPLMGDDGAGERVAELLLKDPLVTAKADVIAAGTDLLRAMDRFEGRERVILVDAAACDRDPGRLSVVDEVLLEARRECAHSLSAPQAVELLRTVMPPLRQARFTWVLIGVVSPRVGVEMSAEVAAAIQQAAALITGLLSSHGHRRRDVFRLRIGS
jgi:hydrogenase maturation protease